MKIVVDASGGEYAPHEIVKGAIKAADEYEIEIALVGNKSVLHVLAGRHMKKRNITIVDASETIHFHESPVKAVRSKPKSSIVVGINLIKNDTASAFVSAGNTGAVVTAAFLNLGKIAGVERPALCSVIDINPSEKPCLLVDAGVNADCRPSYLVEFAHLGTIYAKEVLGIDSPRVGLLSNGEEEKKGNRLTQESYSLLKKANLNFIGNLEGQDILKRTADLIVTDGFTGNIVLKTIEGLGETFLFSLRQLGQLSTAAYHLRARTLLHDIGASSWVRKMDYREHGGACLLGVKGNVIVAHGRSQSKAIKNAINLARQTVERGIVQAIKEHERGADNPKATPAQGR